MRRARDGEPGAFAALVMRYQDRLYNTCYRLCAAEADALDATQNAFLKALEGLPGFAARSSFFTWLFRIAVNEVISQRRARRRRNTVPLDRSAAADGHQRLPATARRDGPDADAERRELARRLEDALEQLDDQFRVVVVLRDIQDMDYATIAQITASPIGTVKSRLHRGRLMLRALIGEREHCRGRTRV